MNDVLPKPFTKEGLLSMLEKHLSHLKKQPPGMEAMGAPPPPPGMHSAKRSMKSEDSPVTSPATVSNWNSPGGLTGVSPSNSTHPDDPYMQAVHNNAGPPPYPVQAGMAPQPMYHTSPGGPMAAPPRQQPGPPTLGPPAPPHRRDISQISGGVPEMGPESKRQQMYGQPLPPQPMPPHMRPPGR